LKITSKSTAYLLNGSENIYWIWYLEGEMHSIWDLWINGIQEYKNNGFFEVGRCESNLVPTCVLNFKEIIRTLILMLFNDLKR
jgi:hypothetical protein